ncbi:hypothetical protein F3Y22_tig00110600pilonHSYRG00121 [Hibiscus syriacus]|uniref:Uncharacterized protein n=1 Tax=Hibiscus syriacus TaxID=106335 RepID=A0A6A3A1W7_HIBSY|nr:hypothetical protein F3Y22_tig00110600pilonHSYRG00121 [Hibiscus syriacus]
MHFNLAKTDFLSPLLQPFFDDVCKEVGCGKGKCKPSSKGTLPYYICECDAGWKQTAADNDDDHPKFLPCIFPDSVIPLDKGGANGSNGSSLTATLAANFFPKREPEILRAEDGDARRGGVRVQEQE